MERFITIVKNNKKRSNFQPVAEAHTSSVLENQITREYIEEIRRF